MTSPETKQLYYKEAKRYLSNAKDVLRKSKKDSIHYLDAKYIRSACGIAYLGILKAMDGYLLLKSHNGFEKPKNVQQYQHALSKLDKKLLTKFNASYSFFHLWNYYQNEGPVKRTVFKDMLDEAQEIVDVLKN
ncbi:MAG: DUF5618 family protein [Chitinophagales bacterium]